MTRFRPCIDLHAGQVKQIVGGTLTEQASDLKTNYVSQQSAGYFAKLYNDTNCLGAHVIMLGPGNEDAAREALSMWPGKLQVGGGITDQNAREWIEAGAEKASLRTSCLRVYFEYLESPTSSINGSNDWADQLRRHRSLLHPSSFPMANSSLPGYSPC